MGAADGRMVRAFRARDGGGLDRGRWPATVPAIAQLFESGFEVPPGVTVLVGENGSGKSTMLELFAESYGLNPQGGSRGAQYRTRSSEPGLGRELTVHRGPHRPGWSYFIRADTMHGLYSYLEDNPGKGPESRYHELSHGEGFLALLASRAREPGFYLMDEPDAPLSFTSCLGLVALLYELARAGSQVVLATHSPVLAATPGATVQELGPWGIRPSTWDDLELVRSWRRFLSTPDAFLHHLADEQE